MERQLSLSYFENGAENLKNDRYLLWNIADIEDGGGFMPLEKDSGDILAEYGLEYVETLKMLMATMRGVKGGKRLNSCEISRSCKVRSLSLCFTKSN